MIAPRWSSLARLPLAALFLALQVWTASAPGQTRDASFAQGVAQPAAISANTGTPLPFFDLDGPTPAPSWTGPAPRGKPSFAVEAPSPETRTGYSFLLLRSRTGRLTVATGRAPPRV